MKKLLIVLILLLVASVPMLAQDPAKVAQKQCKVVLENEYVRVLQWTVGPNEKTLMHSHPALVSISLTGGKTRFTSAEGKTREVDTKPGQVTWSDPEKHSSESLGDKPGEIIQVELKKQPDASMTTIPAAEDPVKIDPKHYKVEFQNARVRVLRIKYGPGEKSVMHSHPADVAVFLTGGESKMTMGDGKSTTSTFKPGQVQWYGKSKHLPANAGTKPFELVLVELK